MSIVSAAAAAALLIAGGLAQAAESVVPAPAAGSGDTTVASRGRPAHVGGLWCGAGLLTGFSLEIAQHAAEVEGKLVRKGRVREITGRVEGAVVRTDPQRNETMELLAQGDELRVTGGTGPLALVRGQSFTRAAGDSCEH